MTSGIVLNATANKFKSKAIGSKRRSDQSKQKATIETKTNTRTRTQRKTVAVEEVLLYEVGCRDMTRFTLTRFTLTRFTLTRFTLTRLH